MKNCQNCDNFDVHGEPYQGILVLIGNCTISMEPDKEKSYCQEWINTTYGPLDGKEDEDVNSYEEI